MTQQSKNGVVKQQFIVPQSAVQRLLSVNAEFEKARLLQEQMVELLRDMLGAPPGWILRYDNGVMQFVNPGVPSPNGMMEGVLPVEA